MQDPLFGAPSADNDHLLTKCLLEHQVEQYQNPIIVGRWGTGKSAILISKARRLEELLADVDKFGKRDWYIREQDLQPESIFELQHRFVESKNAFDITLQKIWKSEIIRRVIIILSRIKKYYQGRTKLEGASWKMIEAFAIKEQTHDSLWSCVENVISVIFPDDNRRDAFRDFASFFNELTSTKLMAAIQRCIGELEDKQLVTPIIGIEPLETPATSLDSDVSVSESVIAALLNCYRNDFIPNEVQRITVLISIPWNRISHKQLILPQHISPYMEETRWTKANLRIFICKRIEEEAKSRNARRITARSNFDAWDAIFEKTIDNKTYRREVRQEDTFDYICRHTFWRARDIQTVARRSVERFCKSNSVSLNDFFRRQLRVDQDTVRHAVSEEATKNAALRLEEARRKFKFDYDLQNVLHGMKVPFSETDLRSRIDPESQYADWQLKMDALWASGLFGYVITFKSDTALRNFRTRFGDEVIKKTPNQQNFGRGFLFEYNTSNNLKPAVIGKMFCSQSDEYECELFMHPTFNEYLSLHVDGGGPLGC